MDPVLHYFVLDRQIRTLKLFDFFRKKREILDALGSV